MYGAILGDIAGSRFEFDRPGWTKDFEFLTGDDRWTDDTVMTIAVAEALIGAGKDAQADDIRKAVIKSMQKWGRKYPYAGYGGRFSRWLRDKDPRAYGSWGNGSAMRVSAAGWLYDSMERTREVARATAEVTHNHPEGIKAPSVPLQLSTWAGPELPKRRSQSMLIMSSDMTIPSLWMR